jgi:hypothetical protein
VPVASTVEQHLQIACISKSLNMHEARRPAWEASRLPLYKQPGTFSHGWLAGLHTYLVGRGLYCVQ